MKAALLGERYSLLWEKLGGIYIFASWSLCLRRSSGVTRTDEVYELFACKPFIAFAMLCYTQSRQGPCFAHHRSLGRKQANERAGRSVSRGRDNHVAGVGLRDRKEPPLLTSTCRWVGCSRWSRPRVRARRSSTAHPWALDLQSEEQWEKHGGRRPRINHRETEQQRQQQQRHSAATSRSPVHMSCATFHGQILRGACRIISG